MYLTSIVFKPARMSNYLIRKLFESCLWIYKTVFKINFYFEALVLPQRINIL